MTLLKHIRFPSTSAPTSSQSGNETSKRRRALSAPLKKPAWIGLRGRQKTSDQAGSLFFRLPLEIRNMIYMDLLVFPFEYDSGFSYGGENIHVLSLPKNGGIRHRRCRTATTECIANCTRPMVHPTLFPSENPSDLLSILLTCRLVYTETVEALYSENTFVFDDLTTFQRFTRSVPPPRLAVMRNIHIKWQFADCHLDGPRHGTFLAPKPYDKQFDAVCGVLAGMHLAKLYVKLTRCSWELTPAWETSQMTALAGITGVKDYVVDVNWEPRQSHGGEYRLVVKQEQR